MAEKNNKTNTEEKEASKSSGMSRKAKRRLISWGTICLVLAAAVIANVIASVLTDKYASLTADITSGGVYNIDDSSVKIAENVKEDVNITFMSDKSTYESYDTYCKQVTNIAEQFAKYSSGKVKVDYIDLIQNPNFQNKYKEESLGVSDIIISCGDKYNILKASDLFNFENYGDYQYVTSSKAESAIDTAIVKVTSKEETSIGIITDYSEDSYTVLEKFLDSNNYKLRLISVEKDDIPSDLKTIIAFAPTQDYSEAAVNKLRNYLKNGEKYGKSLIFIAYRFEVKCPNITKLLSDYGMKYEDGLAFETNTSRMTSTSDGYRNIAAGFAENKLYIDNFDQEKDYPVLVSMSRAVSISNEKIAVPLVEYSAASGVCPYSADNSWNPDDYITGYVPVMAQGYSGGDNGLSRLIFAGSTEMWTTLLSNQQFSNKKYILNILNDINGRQDTGVYLDDKVITKYDLSSVNAQTKNITGIVLYAVLPVLILSAGFCLFLVRRKR